MRLIDADALPKYTGYALSADEVAKAVENAPTIEAEPVRRGRWIVKGQDIYCSVCDNESAYNPFGASEFSLYCPHCGAQMEGEE